MTVVIGIAWHQEMVMLADSRISYGGSLHPPSDCLKKLYPMKFGDRAVVLGFSGTVATARAVVNHIRQDKLPRYRRRSSLANLCESLGLWIQEAIDGLQQKEPVELSVMVCGVEPSRNPVVTYRDGSVLHLGWPEPHLSVYRIDSTKRVVCQTSLSRFHMDIIGSGKLQRAEIWGCVRRASDFGFGADKLYCQRASILSEVVAMHYRDVESATVGGPFQTMRITGRGIEETYTWPLAFDTRGVHIATDGDNTVLTHPVLGCEYTLRPVWDIPSSLASSTM